MRRAVDQKHIYKLEWPNHLDSDGLRPMFTYQSYPNVPQMQPWNDTVQGIRKYLVKEALSFSVGNGSRQARLNAQTFGLKTPQRSGRRWAVVWTTPSGESTKYSQPELVHPVLSLSSAEQGQPHVT